MFLYGQVFCYVFLLTVCCQIIQFHTVFFFRGFYHSYVNKSRCSLYRKCNYVISGLSGRFTSFSQHKAEIVGVPVFYLCLPYIFHLISVRICVVRLIYHYRCFFTCKIKTDIPECIIFCACEAVGFAFHLYSGNAFRHPVSVSVLGLLFDFSRTALRVYCRSPCRPVVPLPQFASRTYCRRPVKGPCG